MKRAGRGQLFALGVVVGSLTGLLLGTLLALLVGRRGLSVAQRIVRKLFPEDENVRFQYLAQ